MPLHSPLDWIHKIWNYEGLNQLPIWVYGFVDPVDNISILIESDIIFDDKSNKIKYSYLLLLTGRTPSTGDSGVTPGFPLGIIE